jgi:hypothetical protein
LATIILSLADLGAAIPLQEALERCGHAVTWDGASASGPSAATTRADLVILDAESDDCIDACAAWRELDPPPGILLVGHTQSGEQNAGSARCPFLKSNASDRAFEEQIQSILKLRFTGKMSPGYARAALRLGPATDASTDAQRIIVGARQVDVDLVRECLRWHAWEYVSTTSMIPELRATRTLTIPEVELAQRLDGTTTVQSFVAPTHSDGIQRGRFLWGLLSCGAAICSAGPPDQATPLRRQITATRAHLLARRQRLERGTYYDVLEVHPDASPEEVDYAARTLALRFSPDRLGQLDLGEYAAIVNDNWQEILTARQLLMDGVERAKYDDTLIGRQGELVSPWTYETFDSETAEEFFRRGQQALVAGEAFKAVSSMAAACRNHPEYPDYEVSLCWAEFRAELERGADRAKVIAARRAAAESQLVGRRPWPRALVALALLCAADSDSEAARHYLHEALSVDPNLPAAQQLLSRMG